MTCIVGIVDKKRVMMAADSEGGSFASGFKQERRDGKLFTNGQFLIGYTSSYRMGQILRHMKLPVGEGSKFMETKFIGAVRKEFRKQGYSTVKDSVDSGGTFLVGVAGQLFKVDSDFQVGESTDDYDACGCGQYLALGSLHATGERAR